MQSVETAAQPPRLGERWPLGVDGLTLRLIEAEAFPAERDGELIELLRSAFNGGPSWFRLGIDPVEHLRWKLRDFPGGAYLELVEDGDIVIGCQIRQLHRYWSQGEEIRVSEGVDLARDPAYQGRGLRAATRALRGRQETLLPQARYGLGLGAHPLSDRRRGRTSRNTLLGNPLLTTVKVIAPARLLRSRLAARFRQPRGFGSAAVGASRTRGTLEAQGVGNRTARSAQIKAGIALAGATFASPLRRAPHGPWSIKTVETFDERADRFWDQARDQFDVVQIRDRDYLNWRFCDPRAGGFTVRAAEQDGELLGYLALRVVDDNAVIADILTLPERLDVARSLIEDAVQVARGRGATQIRCWSVEDHQYFAALRRAGFSSYPNTMSFSYRGWSAPPDELAFLSAPNTRVHFQAADTDHI